MESKEYLSEEKYQKNKKKIIVIALVILIVGLLIGGSLIVTGINKRSDVLKVSSSNQTKPGGRTKEIIQSEIDALNTEIASLKEQGNQAFANNEYAEYSRLNSEIINKQSKLYKLEAEIWNLESDEDNSNVEKEGNEIKATAQAMPFFIFGAFIIFASCITSGLIYFFAKRREIVAFSAQQVMPVAQEGMEKIAPTIGNVAKEISKGVHDGINDNKQ